MGISGLWDELAPAAEKIGISIEASTNESIDKVGDRMLD
jgi:hypothetical protein